MPFQILDSVAETLAVGLPTRTQKDPIRFLSVPYIGDRMR